MFSLETQTQVLDFRHVTEELNRPDKVSFITGKHCGGHLNGQFAAIACDNGDASVLNGIMCVESVFESALAVTDFSAEDVETVLADCLGPVETGNPFGRGVKRGDEAIAIDGENTVADTVKYKST
jgi:hypothetical protein